MTGYIEELNFELDFQLYINELRAVKRVSIAGIQLPIKSKEHVLNLRNFCSKSTYQRNLIFTLSLQEATGKIYLKEVEDNKATKDNKKNQKHFSLTKVLLSNGFARVQKEEEIKNILTPIELISYRAAQDEGMRSRTGIWKDLNPDALKNKAEMNEEHVKMMKQGKFECTVIEVNSGDSVTVLSPEFGTIRLSLHHVKAKSMGNASKGEEAAPWSYEAKEFLRKRIIGEKIDVNMDYVKEVNADNKSFTLFLATIWHKNV